jgi:anti-sigma regulatory factor (Ser/Thr protein kinase)
MPRVIEGEFAPVAESARAARRLVTDALSSTAVLRPELLELFVSEIVTNAIIHAQTRFNVSAEIEAGAVRVSITDRNPMLPAVQSPPPGAIAGRGLKMVSEHATAWGIEQTLDGKTIWFELAVSAADGD